MRTLQKFLLLMKTLILVSCVAAALLSGCSFHSPRPGVVSASGALGSNVEFGYAEKSDVLVQNRYPNWSMEVKLRVISYPNWAFRGDGRDPLLGAPPRPSVVWESRPYVSLPGTREVLAPMNRIVLRNEFVVVLVTWYDVNGRYRDKASEVFRPGNPYYPWHYRFAPITGRFGVALNRDIITTW